MNTLKLTVSYAGEPAPRAFLIQENSNGSLIIDEVGHLRIEGGRSICIHLDRGDSILAVECFGKEIK
jgi:hypothetical protein